jgi:hypothetical protein
MFATDFAVEKLQPMIDTAQYFEKRIEENFPIEKLQAMIDK